MMTKLVPMAIVDTIANAKPIYLSATILTWLTDRQRFRWPQAWTWREMATLRQRGVLFFLPCCDVVLSAHRSRAHWQTESSQMYPMIRMCMCLGKREGRLRGWDQRRVQATASQNFGGYQRVRSQFQLIEVNGTYMKDDQRSIGLEEMLKESTVWNIVVQARFQEAPSNRYWAWLASLADTPVSPPPQALAFFTPCGSKIIGTTCETTHLTT